MYLTVYWIQHCILFCPSKQKNCIYRFTKKSYEISTATIKSLVKANHQESDSGGVSAVCLFNSSKEMPNRTLPQATESPLVWETKHLLPSESWQLQSEQVSKLCLLFFFLLLMGCIILIQRHTPNTCSCSVKMEKGIQEVVRNIIIQQVLM